MASHDSTESQPRDMQANLPQPRAIKRKLAGTGWVHLKEQLESSSSSLNARAKAILQNMLNEQKIKLDDYERTHKNGTHKKARKPIDSNMSDERIMQLAQEGELSFLASLLKVIEEEGGSVTTKFLIKACCLAVEPSKVPALCDAKEMVMAALFFLGNETALPPSNFYPKMPLITPVQQTGDLEKRAYSKNGNWTLDKDDPASQAFLDQVLALERVFYESIDYQWLAREHVCPPLPHGGRDLLLLKGSAPNYIIGKSKKAPAAPRRKTTPKAKKDPEGPALPAASPGSASAGAESSPAKAIGQEEGA